MPGNETGVLESEEPGENLGSLEEVIFESKFKGYTDVSQALA